MKKKILPAKVRLTVSGPNSMGFVEAWRNIPCSICVVKNKSNC